MTNGLIQYSRRESMKENPQKLTQLSSRSHPRHLVGKKTAQKDTIIDITSDSQVNSNFPYRWSPASLTFNNYFYLLLYLISLPGIKSISLYNLPGINVSTELRHETEKPGGHQVRNYYTVKRHTDRPKKAPGIVS